MAKKRECPNCGGNNISAVTITNSYLCNFCDYFWIREGGKDKRTKGRK